MTLEKVKTIRLEQWHEIVGFLISVDVSNGIIDVQINGKVMNIRLPLIPTIFLGKQGNLISILRSDESYHGIIHQQHRTLRSPGVADGDERDLVKDSVGKVPIRRLKNERKSTLWT